MILDIPLLFETAKMVPYMTHTVVVSWYVKSFTFLLFIHKTI